MMSPPSGPDVGTSTPGRGLWNVRPEQAKNSIERRGILLADAIANAGKRLAAALDEPPIDSLPLSPDQIRRMWAFSPSSDPASDFWAFYDQAHAEALAQGLTPDQAASAAETAALKEIYPYREDLCLIGTTTLENQVQRAERIRRLVERGEHEPASDPDRAQEGSEG